MNTDTNTHKILLTSGIYPAPPHLQSAELHGVPCLWYSSKHDLVPVSKPRHLRRYASKRSLVAVYVYDAASGYYIEGASMPTSKIKAGGGDCTWEDIAYQLSRHTQAGLLEFIAVRAQQLLIINFLTSKKE